MNRLKENGKYAFLAGFCGATGSLFGKLSGGYYEYENAWILNISCFITMILFNSTYFYIFLKALQASDSSLRATLLISTSNYLISALFGVLIFDEGNKLLWVCGITMLLIGLVLLQEEKSKLKSN
ncbi:uncharacterized protein LOC123298974 [Chrysoperla carnea]|uniref:uncharacterized protein LOC123298974 n=1 Tax=Chrysoperla carnea TaxID=189513 RepID=UPI001D0814B0|nr:uncharacterized protein LOC123298974 [Chrysoperla carnea]